MSVLPEEAKEALRKGKAEGDQGQFFSCQKRSAWAGHVLISSPYPLRTFRMRNDVLLKMIVNVKCSKNQFQSDLHSRCPFCPFPGPIAEKAQGVQVSYGQLPGPGHRRLNFCRIGQAEPSTPLKRQRSKGPGSSELDLL